LRLAFRHLDTVDDRLFLLGFPQFVLIHFPDKGDPVPLQSAIHKRHGAMALGGDAKSGPAPKRADAEQES
jgi:hypothetical protein